MNLFAKESHSIVLVSIQVNLKAVQNKRNYALGLVTKVISTQYYKCRDASIKGKNVLLQKKEWIMFLVKSKLFLCIVCYFVFNFFGLPNEPHAGYYFYYAQMIKTAQVYYSSPISEFLKWLCGCCCTGAAPHLSAWLYQKIVKKLIYCINMWLGS